MIPSLTVDEDEDSSVLSSFGGLLMKLTGDERNLSSLELDQRLYLLMRKT
jgi:hypothetical protein